MPDHNDVSDLIENFGRYFNSVFDGICAVDLEFGIVYANDSFFSMFNLTRRLIRFKNKKASLQAVPAELGELIDSSMQTLSKLDLRELDLTLNDERKLRVQIRIDVIEGFQGVLVFVKDVDVEFKVHTKYKAQLVRNQQLIDGLRRSLSEAEFLGRVTSNFSLSEDVITLLSAICTGLERDLHFKRAAFVRVKGNQIESSSKNLRVHGSIRFITDKLIELAEAMEFEPAGAVRLLQTPGADVFWLVANVKPRLEKSQLLVVLLESKMIEEETRVFLTNLCVNVSTLLDTRSLYVAASSDPLTKVFNRRYFDSRLSLEVSKALNEFSVMCLLIVDVDHFKKINDTYGHHGGDLVLKAVADRLRYRLRDDDVVARIGGEEFALILPGTRATEAMAVAERLRASLENQSINITSNSGEEVQVKITASFGLAELTPGSINTDHDLFREADAALYSSKSSGRNRVTLFNSKVKNAA